MNFFTKLKNFFKRQKKKIFIGVLVCFFALFTLTVVTYFSVKDKVLTYTASKPIIIYDKDQEIVDSLSIQKGENVSLDEIPVYLQKAFISVEDKRFYSHHGVDVIRLGGAVITNLAKGRIAQGGSTISQQLAKNAFLSNERTFSRKFKELIITFEIERIYSKDEILEKYMDEIYFGSGTYGVGEAAKDIFGKHITELNIAESAMLAGIPNRPTFYNPRKNLENSIKRTHLVLKLMKDQGYISEAQYEEALEHKFVIEDKAKKQDFTSRNVTVIINGGRKKRESSKAPDFVDIVEDQLVDLVDSSILAKGGFKVYTTLDHEMQKVAKSTFQNYSKFKNNKKMQGAMVTLDAKTGEVRSIIGGYNYKSGDFNRGIKANRQIGSTFKPFIYYTAIEKDYTMNQLIDASNHKYGNWNPQNYGNEQFEKITMIEGLEKSINTVAIKLLDEVGIDNVISNFNKTGVDVPLEKDLTIALGSASATPLQLATSYLPFSNGGYTYIPSFITKIEDIDGNILYERGEVKGIEAFDTIDISLTTFMLEQVVTHGTGQHSKLKFKGKYNVDQGGKTGTTNNYRSAWYAGFTPDYVTVVYIGYDDNSSMPYGSSGGQVALPLWKTFYQTMIDNKIYTPSKFEFLEDNIKSGELVYRNIDIRTGEIKKAPPEFRRTILLKKDQVPKSFTKKIWDGFKGWFN